MTVAGKVIQDFASNTTCHGISRVFKPVSSRRFSKFFRFIWMLIWILATAIVIYQIKEIFDEYYQFNTISKVTVRQSGDVEFPTVSICSLNKLAKRRVNKWLQDCDKYNDVYAVSISICDKWKQKWDRVSNDSKSQVKFGSELRDYLRLKHPELANKLSMQFSEMVTSFHNTVSHFNDEAFNLSQSTLQWTPSFPKLNCYSFNFEGKQRQTIPGIFAGLEIFMKTRNAMMPDCYDVDDCGCYLVYLHASGTLPIATTDAVKLCNSTQIAYEFEQRMRMSKPYGNCIEDYPVDMTICYDGFNNPIYTFSSCYANFAYGITDKKFFPLYLTNNTTRLFRCKANVNKNLCLPACLERSFR